MRINHVLMVTAILAALSLAQQANAHVLWVNLTNHYLDGAGDATRAYIGWGHRLPADETLDASRLAHYALIGPDGARSDIAPSPGGFLVAVIKPDAVGPHVVSAARAAGFFTVWEEDGERRYGSVPMTGLANVSSSTYNEMYGKALLGVQANAPEDFSTPVGDTLEIVPLKNPAMLSSGADGSVPALPVRVFFRGEACADTEISATYMGFSTGLDYAQSLETDENGEATFEITQPGIWILHAFTATELRDEFQGQAHGEHYHATLTFEVPRE